ncbi:AaceriAER155Cp [[Ashbya] aceris (nom. inval.)]|nr:AaceriAER155Cp [[Ashbya] aceris (nom. inval.)]
MSLEDAIGKLSLYDAKKYFRKAQNVMLNYTDMEAKVREATNNEPWGASSTLMTQIAQGTYNFREREEILAMILRRFLEKSANEWRQIYKSMQLLEYLVKHGSERFIDDVRSNLNLIRMLETFHYIDSQGRDQGVNVRNRTKALVKLLEDDELIRAERKKARETQEKYKGVAGGRPSHIPGHSVNAAAGFTRSAARGISVSADYDSDDDEGYHKPAPYATPGATRFEEYAPRVQATAEEDADEFSEFQAAPPPPKQNTALVDLMQSTDSSDAHQDLRIPPPPSVTPAIIDPSRKGDPFGSLFSSAKNSASPTNSASAALQPALSDPPSSSHRSDDEEDMFGELTSAPRLTQAKPIDQGPDLLSF